MITMINNQPIHNQKCQFLRLMHKANSQSKMSISAIDPQSKTPAITDSQPDTQALIIAMNQQSNNNIVTLLSSFIQLVAAATSNASMDPVNLSNIRNATSIIPLQPSQPRQASEVS